MSFDVGGGSGEQCYCGYFVLVKLVMSTERDGRNVTSSIIICWGDEIKKKKNNLILLFLINQQILKNLVL
jgi:hypothetical protein